MDIRLCKYKYKRYIYQKTIINDCSTMYVASCNVLCTTHALLGLTVEHAFKLMALLISFLVANQVDFHTFVRCHSTAAQLAQHSIASPLYSRICTLTVRNYYCRKALHALPIHILPPQKVLSSRLIPIHGIYCLCGQGLCWVFMHMYTSQCQYFKF